jgi:hypothetical protein
MNQLTDQRGDRWIDRACWTLLAATVALVVYAGWTVYESQAPRAVLPVTPAQSGIVWCPCGEVPK